MDALDCIRILLYVSRVLGLAPFKYKYRTLEPSKCLTRYSIIIMSVVTCFMGLFSANRIYVHRDSFIECLISASHWLTMTLNSLLTIFVLCRYENVLRGNLIKLNEFKVLKSRLRKKRLKSFRMTTTAYCLGSIFYCTILGVGYYKSTVKENIVFPFPGSSYATFAAMNIAMLSSFTWCVQFVVYTSLIRFYFVLVNEKFFTLKKIADRHGLSVNNPMGRLLTSHDVLTDIAEETATVFSIYLLNVTVLVFVETVYTITHYSVKYGNSLFALIWLFYYILQFTAVVLAAVATSDEAEKTANYLHELFIDNDDPELKEEIEIFSLQLLHRKVEFNACGFFKLDFSLLYSMVGAVTTYIIILMQFQGNNEGSPGNCMAKCPNCTIAS